MKIKYRRLFLSPTFDVEIITQTVTVVGKLRRIGQSQLYLLND